MRANPDETAPAVFEAEVPRCPGYAIRLRLRPADEWNLTAYLDARVWTAWKPGQPWAGGIGGQATRKGFTVPVKQLLAFRASVDAAVDAARAAGLLERG